MPTWRDDDNDALLTELEGDEEVTLLVRGLGLPPRGRRATTRAIAALAAVEPTAGAGGLWIYGDGSDGDLVLTDGQTWVPGFYGDVTIEEGATVTLDLSAVGWPVFRCAGTFNISGILDMRGSHATDRNGATGPLSSAPFLLGNGMAGTTENGEDSGPTDGTLHTTKGAPKGGAGGDGDNGTGGAAVDAIYPRSLGPSSGHLLVAEVIVDAPRGGAGGAGDGTNFGGGGGSGGLWAFIAARHVVHGANHVYLVNGGDGAPGGDDGTGDTGNGDCGGGGGGAGAYWTTLCDTIDDIPANINTVGNHSFAGTGGAGGAGCGTGDDGQAGEDGFVVRLMNA